MSDLEQRARDLAAYYDIPVEQAVFMLRRALTGEPVNMVGVAVRHRRWWARLVPGWRLREQRRILEAIENMNSGSEQ